MDDSLPKHCIIFIGYLKGISKRDIIEQEWFDLDSAAGEHVYFYVEKKGKKLRFRDCDGTSETKFGTWEHVVEDAQKILGEDLEIIRQVMTVAGVGEYDQVYDDFEVNTVEGESLKVDLPERDGAGGIGGYGLAFAPKRRLEKSIAVCREVITDWDDKEFPDDDPLFDEDLTYLSFICPEEGDIDFSQEDIDIYKELAEKDNAVAQYLLGVEYKLGSLSHEKDNQLLAQQWLCKAAENGNSEADSLLNGDDSGDYDDSDSTEGDDNDLSYPERAWQYQDDSLLLQTSDLDIDDCLVEIKLRENLNKEEELLTQEQFSLDDQPVTFQVYKHDGQLGLVQDNEVQYFGTEAEFVAACLRMTGEKFRVMTVVQGLAFCGLIDYWTAFDGKAFTGALGTQELNIFEQYNYDCLSRFSAFALSNGFAISRRVAPEWQPGQTTPTFDEAHDLIAVIVEEGNANTLFKDDWKLLQNLVKEGNPHAMLASAQVYYYGDAGEPDVDQAEELAEQALGKGCQSATKFLEEIKEYRENYSD